MTVIYLFTATLKPGLLGCHNVQHCNMSCNKLKMLQASISLTVSHWNSSKNYSFTVTNETCNEICIIIYEGFDNVKIFWQDQDEDLDFLFMTKSKTTFLVLEESWNRDPKAQNYRCSCYHPTITPWVSKHSTQQKALYAGNQTNKWLCYGRGTARQLVSRNSVTTKHPI